MVVERLNGMEITRAALVQQAVGSLLSKKAAEQFKKTMKELTPNGE